MIQDVHEDARFRQDPRVHEKPEIRFFAAYPLRSESGNELGSFCILDHAPRSLEEGQLQMLRDMGALVERELETLDLATLDPLTGLSNRLGFETLASHCLAAARRQGEKITLLHFDLDGFKSLNDAHGHLFGDRALSDFGDALVSAFRDSDVIARLGGDEFVVLMNGSGQTGTVRPLAAIAKSLSERGENGVFPVSYSMGTCIFDPERHDSVHAMLDEADGAMYSVKRGRQAS